MLIVPKIENWEIAEDVVKVKASKKGTKKSTEKEAKT